MTLEFDGDTHVCSLLSASVTTEPQPRDELIIFLSEFLSGHKLFTSTATDLAEELEQRSGEPFAPAALIKRLIRCRDELVALGIMFETHRTGDRRELRLAHASDGSGGNNGGNRYRCGAESAVTAITPVTGGCVDARRGISPLSGRASIAFVWTPTTVAPPNASLRGPAPHPVEQRSV